MLIVLGCAIFLAATLLFMVQPMAAKLILPVLGGSPQVWATSMVFFQAALLGAYAYAHLLTSKLTLKGQVAVHAVVIVLAACTLPIGRVIAAADAGDAPVRWVLGALAVMVGAPFFVVAASSPLLSKWFSATDHPKAKDPYFLYVASNAGSIVGLLAYPFVMEAKTTLSQQTAVWTFGFAGLIPVLLLGGVLAMKRERAIDAPAAGVVTKAAPAPRAAPLTWGRRLRWVVLAMVPSSLMIGVTQHISTDIAALPLLWVIPLLLYLVTFMLAFSPRVRVSSAWLGRVLVVGAVLVGVSLVAQFQGALVWQMVLHVGTFFVGAWMCHKMLSDDRPPAERLTEFYMLMSLGGCLGGIFNGLVAPHAFSAIVEYPIALAAALVLWAWPKAWTNVARIGAVLGALGVVVVMVVADRAVTQRLGTPEQFAPDTAVLLRAWLPGLLCLAVLVASVYARTHAKGVVTAGAMMLGGMLVASPFVANRALVLHRERTFFGVHEVIAAPSGRYHILQHGTTNHGVQMRNDPLLSRVPTAYFHPSGPIGDVMKVMQQRGRLQSVAIVGMGAGSLAGYGLPGSTWTFYEIDPAVVRIANTPEWFSFLKDSQATITTKVGDGRIRLREAQDASYDLIVLDAFSSDAMPLHLMTLQAVQEVYLPKLKPGGVLAFNISSRYFDLAEPLARVGNEAGLVVFNRVDDTVTPAQRNEARKESSEWVAMAASPEDLGPITTLPTWRLVTPRPGPVWTDDYANPLSVLRSRIAIVGKEAK